MIQEKIGIIGLGYVGWAVFEAYRHELIDLVCIDTDSSKNAHGTYDELHDASGVFVCVPSPTLPNGDCDDSILISVLENLKDFKGVIISKVTAPPNVYKKLKTEYPNLVHAPEFLTAKNSVLDYKGTKYSIIGGSVKAYINEAHRLIKLGIPDLEMSYHCTIEEASLSKYVINTFLATKVVFMNEMATLAESSDINWGTIRNLIALDRRIGNSHTQVPGPDGTYGFGGICFPKDTEALLKYAESQKVQMNVLDAAAKKNLLLRLTNSK